MLFEFPLLAPQQDAETQKRRLEQPIAMRSIVEAALPKRPAVGPHQKPGGIVPRHQ